MELLSVIVPVYNSEKYIRQCVDSILEQSYPYMEIILVDDGSLDGSGRICDKYAEKFQNVTSVHQSNKGITGARLAGVECAKGELIAFVDADDWIQKDFYKKLCEEGTSYDLIVSGIYRYISRKKQIEEKTYYQAGDYGKKEIMEKIIPNMLWSPDLTIWALDPSLCTKIFRRELLLKELKKVVSVGSDYGEDTMVIFPMLLKIRNMKVVNEAFYYHRQRKSGSIPYYISDDRFFEKLYAVYVYLKNEFCTAGYWDVMRGQLEHFYYNSVELKKSGYRHTNYGFFPVFPFWEIERNSRIILYGAGKSGRIYIEQNEIYHFCNIICWVDRNYENIEYEGKSIEDPRAIGGIQFDYIVIAVDDYYAASQIVRKLQEKHVPKDKIIWQSTRRCTDKIM